MPTIVKFATVDVDLFNHLELGIRRSWKGIDLDKCTPEQLEALKLYSVRPRIVQVHAEDADAFEGYRPKPAKPATK